MSERPEPLTLTYVDAESGPAVRQVLVDVYAEVYTEALDQPFFSVAEFDDRLGGYMAAPGWGCVLARVGAEPSGYAFGYALRPNARWWQGLRTPVDPAAVEETGKRTFALNEIMVRGPWRGTGAARRIHDALMARREEERATLLVEQSHPRVRARYEQWGYRFLGVLRPDLPDAPVFDALVLPLGLRPGY